MFRKVHQIQYGLSMLHVILMSLLSLAGLFYSCIIVGVLDVSWQKSIIESVRNPEESCGRVGPLEVPYVYVLL